MEATDLDRYGLTVGGRRITYDGLKHYLCNDCGGCIVHKFRWNGETTVDEVCCGICGGTDIVHEATFQRQVTEADEVLAGLPPALRALIAPETEESKCHSGIEAIADLFG